MMTNFVMKRVIPIMAGASILAVTALSKALCTQEHDDTYDDLASILIQDPSCADETFHLYFKDTYQAIRDDYIDRGWSDPCNPTLELTKNWLAAYLLWFGVDWDGAYVVASGGPGPDIVVNRAFHSSYDDYGPVSTGTGKIRGHVRWHRDYHTGVADDLSDEGFTRALFSAHDAPITGYLFGAHYDSVKTSCYYYSPRGVGSAPGKLAGAFIHEAWHSFNRNKGDTWYSHHSCQSDVPGQDVRCEFLNVHPKGAFAKGHWYESGPQGLVIPYPHHAPMGSNQAANEFACDLADFPQTWVPTSVRRSADDEAGSTSHNFVDGARPPYMCGPPTPYGGAEPIPGRLEKDLKHNCGIDGIPCDGDVDCPPGFPVCNEAGCCQEGPPA